MYKLKQHETKCYITNIDILNFSDISSCKKTESWFNYNLLATVLFQKWYWSILIYTKVNVHWMTIAVYLTQNLARFVCIKMFAAASTSWTLPYKLRCDYGRWQICPINKHILQLLKASYQITRDKILLKTKPITSNRKSYQVSRFPIFIWPHRIDGRIYTPVYQYV